MYACAYVTILLYNNIVCALAWCILFVGEELLYCTTACMGASHDVMLLMLPRLLRL